MNPCSVVKDKDRVKFGSLFFASMPVYSSPNESAWSFDLCYRKNATFVQKLLGDFRAALKSQESEFGTLLSGA